MTFWTTPTGEKLTFKEFIERWKKGIEGITPLQQIKGQIKFTWIMILGFTLGIIVSLFYIKRFFWVIIVLVAAIGNSLISLIGMHQKVKQLESFENFMKGGQNE